MITKIIVPLKNVEISSDPEIPATRLAEVLSESEVMSLKIFSITKKMQKNVNLLQVLVHFRGGKCLELLF